MPNLSGHYLVGPTLYDGTENLGAQYYSSSNYAVGKVCPIATITPAGVYEIVQAGWDFKRDRWSHDFKDGTNSSSYYDTNWTDDTSLASWKRITPDSDDKIYDLDGPNVLNGDGATSSYETYNNFRQWIEWNGEVCSSKGSVGLWYWKGRWKADQTPQVTLKEVGTGGITLPSSAYYPIP